MIKTDNTALAPEIKKLKYEIIQKISMLSGHDCAEVCAELLERGVLMKKVDSK